jgi:hypothetical protein
MNPSESQPARATLSPGWMFAGAAIIAVSGAAIILLMQDGPGDHAGAWTKVEMSPYPFGDDDRGNHAMIDVEQNSVSIAATGRPRITGRYDATKQQLVLTFPARRLDHKWNPELELHAVKRMPNHLCIRLPDGREEAFAVPAGFARQLSEFNRSDGSYLQNVSKLLRGTSEHARLEEFLAGFEESAAKPTEAPSTAP